MQALVNDPVLGRRILNDPARFRTVGPGTHGELMDLAIGPDALLNMDGPTHEALIEGNVVSIVGRFGVPRSATTTKLIARHMVGHDTVRSRAFDISTRNRGGSPVDHWLQAERELLSK